MAIDSLDALAPDTRAAVEQYLAAVDAALRPRDTEVADLTIEDLREHMRDVLDPASTPDDVERLADVLGAPAIFAESVQPHDASADRPEPAGRIVGIPYDFRFTPARVAMRWWNPRDPRLFMPRAFGVGWDLNFGALAVRLGLIEPDAEDEPFGAVSDRGFLVALIVPVALTAFIIGSYVATLELLPAMLPTHWNAAGVPDGYWTQGAAFGFLLAIAAAPTGWAAWSVVTRRPALARGAVLGVASFASALAAGVWALTLTTVFAPPVGPALPPLLILPSLLVPLAVFVGLARAGRSAEQRHDLHVSPGR